MKNTITIILIAIVVAGNGVIAGLRLDAANRLADDRTQIAALAADNTAIQSGIDALQAEQEQAATSLTALENAAAALSTTPSGSPAKYAGTIEAIKQELVKVNATGPGLRGYSSGVLVSANGYVLTVLHSVSGANSIKITLANGETLDATLAGTDAVANLALLKITTTRLDLSAAALGSIATVVTGQTVICAGFPLSPELPGPATFTVGIVSALRTAADFYFIQSDASIGIGSGGGGLFALDGKLTAIASEQRADGIYLFIPIDAAASLLAGIKVT